MSTTTARLSAAATLISRVFNKPVTSIQFEDGSGNKFNYSLGTEAKMEFADLSASKSALDSLERIYKNIEDGLTISISAVYSPVGVKPAKAYNGQGEVTA